MVNLYSLFITIFLTLSFLGRSGSNLFVKGNVVESGFNFKDGFDKNKLKKLHKDFRNSSFAVLPFKSASAGKTFSNKIATDGNGIADMLTIQMLFYGYNVVERNKIKKIFNEKSLSMAGVTSQEKDQAVKIGKMLGVKYIIYGSVTQYYYQPVKDKWKISLGVTSKIISVDDASIVLAMSAETQGNNLSDALDGITIAFTDLLRKENVYEWQN